MTLGILRDVERNYDLMRSQFKGAFIYVSMDCIMLRSLDTDTIDDAIILCQTCRHGGHASHILDWFFGQDGMQSHATCAVADCDCRCADEF